LSRTIGSVGIIRAVMLPARRRSDGTPTNLIQVFGDERVVRIPHLRFLSVLFVSRNAQSRCLLQGWQTKRRCTGSISVEPLLKRQLVRQAANQCDKHGARRRAFAFISLCGLSFLRFGLRRQQSGRAEISAGDERTLTACANSSADPSCRHQQGQIRVGPQSSTGPLNTITGLYRSCLQA
jgi:hypothetical protein